MQTLIDQLEKIVEAASRPGVLGAPGRRVEKRAQRDLGAYFHALGEKIRNVQLEKLYQERTTALTKAERASTRHSVGAMLYNALRVTRPSLVLALKSNMLDAISAARKHDYKVREADRAQFEIEWRRSMPDQGASEPQLQEADQPYTQKGPSLFDAVSWAEEQAASLVTGLDDTTLDLLAGAVADGIDQQLGPAGTGRLIRGVVDDMTTSRALTIASTEMNRAMSMAAAEQLDVLGVEYKQIILSPDACPICQDNADQDPLPIDEDYDSGDPYPPFHPNCRCAITGARAPEDDEG